MARAAQRRHELPALLTLSALHNQEGNVSGYVAMAVDISARKHAEQALHDSEAYARLLFEASPDAIIVLEVNGTILDVNRAFESQFGIGRAEVQGHMYNEFGGLPREQLRMGRAMYQALAAGRLTDGFELTVHLRDGSERIMEVRMYPIVAGGRQLVVATSHDITLHKQAEALVRQSEQAVRQANVELERAARAKDEFLASMSHELRTPLTSVLMMAETLLEQRRGPLNPYQVKWMGLKSCADCGRNSSLRPRRSWRSRPWR